ncbi:MULTISPECIES: UDP-N-acetylglucosamine--N-acetylmuramyl-(pentapeptide) pyrophosphoryl-undecaprenol N-acetylglucosamine transferase [unclassified Streptomyces]|uniref:UDP-N-acetylglucosamine--N-acetylmuramyl- (pentapeptide) pyrophosphoryl-undecaprenol N-acetylglucosamine transferase n=1 Tax=unclassified Streptomyces TaxID=2593676 RepID=UPI00081DABE3|nr:MULTISPECIES: UDP-N-acetylglucosamine--N-acetylmuramyl-(pentapeptide) pyrophosphoryl-undecaprenol N-acetylglucosamine transferase [unclassified Streptomyces]MYZ37962.1 UDP-N-acetylglucosamine--N-acetylmuramyl-(pentapeptide) pyrophosphoryl-undecaprenol N-acetylglucosamine transferase [Streptomyces sp. SID4917]SCF95389.1 UDP-N-acetylglucosamine-N-acetylmuramylpentapeptide N-acetylglucosamine transferase [Streptomyces sp. MnatMP-M17]
MKIAITGGGSAGHVVPALSVAARLPEQGVKEVVFFGRPDSIEHEYPEKAGIPFCPVPSAGLKRHGSWSNLLMPLTVLRGIGVAARAMRRERPNALFSKGSYVSVPVGIAAWLCRVPIVVHESDHSLGLANKIVARMATRVCLSVAAPASTPRWLTRKSAVTGLPLRHDLASGEPERLRRRLGIPASAPVLLIFCGSSGSQRINDAVKTQLGALCARFAVVHVRGKGNLDRSLKGVPGYWQLEYLHDEMADALWLADLVIGRAGATTLAELEALGKRAVLIPLPATVSRGDQLDNAAAYARRHPGQCIVVPDDDKLHGGASLAKACMELAAGLGRTNRERPGPETIHRAADLIAQETVAAARSGRIRRTR